MGRVITREKLAYLLVPVPLLAAVAFFSYLIGIFWLAITEHDEACMKGLVHQGARFREELQDEWALTSTCVFEDGTTHVEAFTPWVPPVLVASQTAAVVCTAIGLWAGSKRSCVSARKARSGNPAA